MLIHDQSLDDWGKVRIKIQFYDWGEAYCIIVDGKNLQLNFKKKKKKTKKTKKESMTIYKT